MTLQGFVILTLVNFIGGMFSYGISRPIFRKFNKVPYFWNCIGFPIGLVFVLTLLGYLLPFSTYIIAAISSLLGGLLLSKIFPFKK